MNTRVENAAQPTAHVENNAFQLAAALKSGGVGQASDASIKARLGQVLGNLTGGKITSIERLVYFTGKRRQQLENSLQTEVRAASGGRITNWQDLLGKKPDAANPLTALGNIKLPNGQTVGKTVGSALAPLVKPLKDAPLPGGLSFNQAATIANNVSRPLPKSVVPPAKGRPTPAAQKPTSTGKPQASVIDTTITLNGKTLGVRIDAKSTRLTFPDGSQRTYAQSVKNMAELSSLPGVREKVGQVSVPEQIARGVAGGVVEFGTGLVGGAVDLLWNKPSQLGRTARTFWDAANGDPFQANRARYIVDPSDPKVDRSLLNEGLSPDKQFDVRTGSEILQDLPRDLQRQLLGSSAVNALQENRPVEAFFAGGTNFFLNALPLRLPSGKPPGKLAVKSEVPNTRKPSGDDMQRTGGSEPRPSNQTDSNPGQVLIPPNKSAAANQPGVSSTELKPTTPIDNNAGKGGRQQSSIDPNSPDGQKRAQDLGLGKNLPYDYINHRLNHEQGRHFVSNGNDSLAGDSNPSRPLTDGSNGSSTPKAQTQGETPNRVSAPNQHLNAKSEIWVKPANRPVEQAYTTTLGKALAKTHGLEYGGPVVGDAPPQDWTSRFPSLDQTEGVKATQVPEPSGKVPKQTQEHVEQLAIRNAQISHTVESLANESKRLAGEAEKSAQKLENVAREMFPEMSKATEEREVTRQLHERISERKEVASNMLREFTRNADKAEMLANQSQDPNLQKLAQSAREAQQKGAEHLETLDKMEKKADKASTTAGAKLQTASDGWKVKQNLVAPSMLTLLNIYVFSLYGDSNSGKSAQVARENLDQTIENSRITAPKEKALEPDPKVIELFGLAKAAEINSKTVNQAGVEGNTELNNPVAKSQGDTQPPDVYAKRLTQAILDRMNANNAVIEAINENQTALRNSTGQINVGLTTAVTGLQGMNSTLLSTYSQILGTQANYRLTQNEGKKNRTTTQNEGEKNRTTTQSEGEKNRALQGELYDLTVKDRQLATKADAIKLELESLGAKLNSTQTALTQYEAAKASAYARAGSYSTFIKQDANGDWYLDEEYKQIKALKQAYSAGAVSEEVYGPLFSNKAFNTTASGTIVSDSAYQQSLKARAMLQERVNTLTPKAVAKAEERSELAKQQQVLLSKLSTKPNGGTPE